MARSEARIYTEIWEDGDFLALDSDGQWLYMFLLSQPDLAHSGVIPLRERRWARKSKSGSVDRITHGLTELEAHFLIVDWDTEEVFVRSLLRRDRIFRQPNVLRAAVDHIPLVQSLTILDALCMEVVRIRSENPVLSEHQEAAMAELESALAKRVKSLGGTVAERPTGNPTENPSEKGSVHPSGNATPEVPGERGGTKEVPRTEDLPRTPAAPPPPVASLPPAGARQARTRTKGTAARITADFAVTPAMVEWATKNVPGVDGKHETAKFVSYWLGESGPRASKVDWVAAWRNWMLKAFERLPGSRASPHATPASSAPERIPDDEKCPNPDHRDQRAKNCRHCAALKKAGMLL